MFRSHKEDQHTQLRGVPHHDQRVQRVLRVLGGAIVYGHRDDQPAPAHHVRGPVLQHHGHRRRKYTLRVLLFLLLIFVRHLGLCIGDHNGVNVRGRVVELM